MSHVYSHRSYLGDGVYVEHDGWHIILSTERDGRTEKIYLDPSVFDSLQRYAAMLLKKYSGDPVANQE